MRRAHQHMRALRYVLILIAAIMPLLIPHAALAGPLFLQAELVTSGLSTFDFDGGAVAVSADGGTALVSARRYNNDRGLVTVFVRIGGPWSKQATLAPSDLIAGDDFGTSVALSGDGNTAFVGAPYRTAGSGIVYIFSRNGTTWTQTGTLTESTVVSGDFFGSAVALSTDGTTAAIGISGRATGFNSGVGAVALFTRGAGATYTAGPILTASDGVAYDNFGTTVAINRDGTVIVTGAASKSNATGAAYVFTGSGASYAGQSLMRGDAVTGDAFGTDVAVSADGAIQLIGAPHKTVGANSNAGAAYLYTKSGASYTAAPPLTAADNQPNDQYGTAVALSGDASLAGVAAPYRNSNTGAVYTLTGSGGSYTPFQTLSGPVVSGGTGYAFGTSLDVSADGTTAIFGAPGKNQNTGTAYAYNSPGGAPTITGVSPGSGPLVGGNTITITGTNFQGGASVKFGTLISPNVTWVSATQLRVIVPKSLTSAVVPLTLTNGDGQTVMRSQGYDYVNAMPIPSHAAKATVRGMPTPDPKPTMHATVPAEGPTTPTPLPQPIRH